MNFWSPDNAVLSQMNDEGNVVIVNSAVSIVKATIVEDSVVGLVAGLV